ncbi:aminopeptidase N [Trueperella pyogenes]|uniref:aminopeptidase N n=1 Tax=Trueperella pyogenes TaxID=1661 RepID=UPI0017D180FB|nr:aminopeptidase N [Trueperella pyogenes]MBB3024993.1 aminopeptidase N [Trueperella pyogenes]
MSILDISLTHLDGKDAMPGTNLTRAEAAARAELIHTQTYRVELDLTGEETFRSKTTVRFAARPGASSFIDLIADEVCSIILNGEDLPVDSYADSRIPLPNLAEDNELHVEAICPFSHTGEGLHRAVDPADGEVYLYSQFEVPDARRMYANFEQPDLKAEFTFVVDAPENWKVFSVSPTPEPTPLGGGVARWEFTPTERISTYLTAIVAGPYVGQTGSYTSTDGREIPMGVYARASLGEYLDAQECIDITIQGMEVFENEFDVPYPFRKYDQIFVPEFNAGAMEHPGCVTILDDYVFRSRPTGALVERRAITIIHELAHMWFGDLVTMKWWNDLWLNESFAEFMSHVATAKNTRWTDAWVTFNASEKVWAQAQDQLPSTHPIAAEIRDLEDVMVNFDGITYGKGASVFQQLVAYVGYDEFMTGVSRYLKKKSWGNATLADLLVELEAASGRDLKQWSKLWLEEAGINTLCPIIEMDGETIASFAIKQTCDEHASLRPHRIGVGGYSVVGESLVRAFHHELDIDGELTEVSELAGIQRPDLILINDGDLAYAKVRLDERSAAAARDHINAFTERLPRTLVLASMWDMCRDAELPASDYIELALSALETEDHGTVLRYLLAQLETATKFYSAPANRPALREKVAKRLFEMLKSTEPGSDRQLQIAMSAVGLSMDEQLDTVAGWLADDAVPAGLAVDANFRWVILRRLAAAGRVDEEAISAEFAERDNTASGAAGAARARASISESGAKERAWEDIVGGKVSNSVQRALGAGFTDGDPELLVAYVERFFGEILNQWENRTLEFSQNFVNLVYPAPLIGLDLGIDLIARTEQWLAENSGSAPALRRMVRERLSNAQRAAAAQSCDAKATRS